MNVGGGPLGSYLLQPLLVVRPLRLMLRVDLYDLLLHCTTPVSLGVLISAVGVRTNHRQHSNVGRKRRGKRVIHRDRHTNSGGSGEEDSTGGEATRRWEAERGGGESDHWDGLCGEEFDGGGVREKVAC